VTGAAYDATTSAAPTAATDRDDPRPDQNIAAVVSATGAESPDVGTAFVVETLRPFSRKNAAGSTAAGTGTETRITVR
jgi:hypothetical protein